MRWSAVSIIVAVWNALFMVDLLRARGFPPFPGPFALMALGLVFLLCIATLNFPIVQRLILKPGREIGEIRPFLRLLFFISGLMFTIFSFLIFSGALDQMRRH